MSKVLVDPAALEEAAKWLEVHSSSSGSAEAFAADALRKAIAQPAEAEGVEIRRVVLDALVSMIAGVTSMIPPTDQPLPDFVQAPVDRAVERITAALAAVTAERDRLARQVQRMIDQTTPLEPVPGDPMWSRRIQLDDVVTERDQLRAEVGRYVPLHEAVQRAAGELPEGWAIQLYIERDGGGVELIGPDGTVDFATNNERLDYTVIDALEAAMAAKEA